MTTPPCPVRQYRRADQCHRLRQVQEADRGGKSTTRPSSVARQQVEAGAQVIDVNMDEGLLDSKQAMVHLPEPDRVRARHLARADHDRQLQVGGDRGRAQVRARQERSSIRSAMKEGEEKFLATGQTQCLRYGAAVVVMAFDEQGQADTAGAQGGDLRPALIHTLVDQGRLPTRGHHLRPQHFRRGDRDRGAPELCGGLHRGHPADQGKPCPTPASPAASPM